MKSLMVFLAAVLVVQALGTLVTYPAIKTWYAHLKKPSFNPPGWIFGPVWSVLYLMIAVSGWRIWQNKGETDVSGAMLFYGLQLGLNCLWSFLFFGIKNPRFAFYEIFLLWVSIGCTILVFFPLDMPAALLLIPYWAWVSFASLLNFSIWRLNR